MPQLVLHTAAPKSVQESFQKPPYRNVVGVEGMGSNLRIDDDRKTTAEVFELPSTFALGIVRCIERVRHIKSLRSRKSMSCHMGAAIMTGYNPKIAEDPASAIAHKLVGTGRPGFRNNLPAGTHCAMGVIYANDPTAFHSFVALGGNLCIQIDGPNEPMSILPYDAIYNCYKKIIGSSCEQYS